MVDLAKIRKKVKGKKADDEAKSEPQAQDQHVEQNPAAEQSREDASPATAPDPAPASPPAPAPAAREAAAPAASSKLDRFKEEAGRRRETLETLSAAVDAAAAGETIHELLTFLIAGEQYAVDIEKIVEIVRPRPTTRIPNADASIVGIVSLRGTIVTIVDVRAQLRHAPMASETDDTRVVVVELRGEMLGFTVDRVLRVVKVAQSSIEPHPIVHASEQHEAIRGVFRVANALTILLDLDKLLDHKAHAEPAAAKSGAR